MCADLFQVHEVCAAQSQTIVDVVVLLQRHNVPVLMYRFACWVRACGSCAMAVGGWPRWTLCTQVENVVDSR
jgi:succinate dehydrogenase/fumarate reductase-like Fe-S protein